MFCYGKYDIIISVKWLIDANMHIKRSVNMSGKVCYNNLFKLLIDKGLKKSELAKMCSLSSPTMAKLSKNEYVSMDVLVRICRGLDCSLNDIVEIVNHEER